MPCSRLNSSVIQSMIFWSKSSPPRKVSPLVAMTSKTPSPTRRIEMSKGRDRDDGLGHLLAELRLGVGLHLLEDHGRDLGR
jgi:hypothetical protein